MKYNCGFKIRLIAERNIEILWPGMKLKPGHGGSGKDRGSVAHKDACPESFRGEQTEDYRRKPDPTALCKCPKLQAKLVLAVGGPPTINCIV